MKKLEEFVKSDEVQAPGRRSALLRPDIAPLTAYIVLRNVFGEPIDLEGDSEKTQWEYLLRYEDKYISIYDWKLDSLSIAIYEESENLDENAAQKLAESVSAALIKASNRNKGQLDKLAKDTKFQILENPYSIYKESAERLLKTDFEFDMYSESAASLAAIFLYISSFEGFMNLIYEFFLKPALCEQRIFDRLSREQIDVKVRLAPIYCDCFSTEEFDHNVDEFRKFHSLMNMRNSFIHANIAKPMRHAVVVEDGFNFVVRESFADKFGLPLTPSDLRKEDAENVGTVISDMVDLVMDSMRPRDRQYFDAFIDAEQITVSFEESQLVMIWAE